MTARNRLPAFLRGTLLASLLLPLAAHGAIVTTSTDEDDGSLGGGTGVSLREAVNYSTSGDIITFAPALSGQTIRLTLGELLIDRSLTIDGSALPMEITLSGDKAGNGKTPDDNRILRITTGMVLLDSLILSGGYMNTGSYRYGGAIYASNSSTQLTVRNSTISNNESTTYGGGIYFVGGLNSATSFLKIQKCRFTGNDTGHDGGAIHMSGSLIVEDSMFSNNTAYQGCGIYHNAGIATVERSHFSDSDAYGYGGAIYNNDTFILRESTVTGNTATRGGGIYGSSGTLTIETSTLSYNSASSSGGGIIASGVLNITNSTISRNSSATSGGGIYCNVVTASLVSSTVSANSATNSDGGIYNNERSPLTLVNSIVAGNTAPVAMNMSGIFTGSYNLTSGAPLLAPLGDYGGPTQTMPPLPGSPAYKSAGGSVPETDQRGFTRVEFPDIGAAEYQGAADAARYWHLDFDGDGSPFGVEQSLGTDPFVPDPAHPANFSGPVINTAGHAVLNFGLTYAPTRAAGTRWIVTRSPDLSPGSFTEIFRTTGYVDEAASGITFVRTSTNVALTDTNPPPGGGFYRFEALLEI